MSLFYLPLPVGKYISCEVTAAGNNGHIFCFSLSVLSSRLVTPTILYRVPQQHGRRAFRVFIIIAFLSAFFLTSNCRNSAISGLVPLAMIGKEQGDERIIVYLTLCEAK